MQLIQSLNELFDRQDAPGPYVSLYQPTHRQHPENKQDPIVFRNLVKQLEASLGASESKEAIASMLAPFHKLADDSLFWNHTSDGIAVFAAQDFHGVMHLHRPTTELAVVADSFHIKPLLRVVQSADRFQVLCMSRQGARFFEGNRDALEEAAFAEEVPTAPTDVIGDEVPEPVSRVRSTGGVSEAAGSGARYSHGTKKEIIDQQTERFFREVDRAFTTHHSNPSGLPLILAALPEHHAPFREVSRNSHLVAEGVTINPDALSVDELRQLAWKVMEPYYLKRLAGFVDQFNAARNDQQASADMSDVAAAAVAGRVRVLLLEADRYVPGRIDAETGTVQFNQQDEPQIDDMFDDLGELVLRNGGEVVMVPSERMPVATGVAAIYRY